VLALAPNVDRNVISGRPAAPRRPIDPYQPSRHRMDGRQPVFAQALGPRSLAPSRRLPPVLPPPFARSGARATYFARHWAAPSCSLSCRQIPFWGSTAFPAAPHPGPAQRHRWRLAQIVTQQAETEPVLWLVIALIRDLDHHFFCFARFSRCGHPARRLARGRTRFLPASDNQAPWASPPVVTVGCWAVY